MDKPRQSTTFLWVLLSTLILYGLLIVQQALPVLFTGGLLPYFMKTLIITGGHIIALTLPLLLSNLVYGRQQKQYLRSNMLAVSGVQIFWRWGAVSIAHIDCANSCVPEITPERFDYLLILITAIALYSTSVLVARRFGK